MMRKEENGSDRPTMKILSERETMKRIGDRMLRGWKMIATPCPVTGYPLIEKNGIVFSVACDMEVKREDSTSSSSSSSASTREAATKKDWDILNGLTSGRLRKRLEQKTKKDAPPPTKGSSESPSPQKKKKRSFEASIGDLLVQGWTMLDEQCPITGEVPLMRHPTDGRKYSVAAETFVDEEERIVRKDENASDSTVRPADGGESSVVGFVGETRDEDDSDAYGREIGDLLLKGWTMLQEPCPFTHAVPLMRNRDGRKYSVAAKRFVDDVEDEKKTTNAEDMEKKEPSTPNTRVILEKNDREHSVASTKSVEASLGPEGPDDNDGGVLGRAASSLRRKLDALRKSLDASHEPRVCGDLAQAMLHCANSLAGIEGIIVRRKSSP